MRLWCKKCRAERTMEEALKKPVDTMFGDGMWWHCRACGTELKQYPALGAQEEAVLGKVRSALIRLEQGDGLEPLQTCQLLWEMQDCYAAAQNRVAACAVLFNLQWLAQTSGLSGWPVAAAERFNQLAAITLGLPHQTCCPLPQLLERFVRDYCPQ